MPRNRDCLADLPSGFEGAGLSLFTLVLLPKLLILKKFFNRWGKWLDAVVCLEVFEKFRFSVTVAA